MKSDILSCTRFILTAELLPLVFVFPGRSHDEVFQSSATCQKDGQNEQKTELRSQSQKNIFQIDLSIGAQLYNQLVLLLCFPPGGKRWFNTAMTPER